jgi:hypothetical protein
METKLHCVVGLLMGRCHIKRHLFRMGLTDGHTGKSYLERGDRAQTSCASGEAITEKSPSPRHFDKCFRSILCSSWSEVGHYFCKSSLPSFLYPSICQAVADNCRQNFVASEFQTEGILWGMFSPEVIINTHHSVLSVLWLAARLSIYRL